jgi:molybdate-binding protein
MISPGNPLHIDGLAALARPGIRFANRQAGSGTRVWLDTQLAQKSLDAHAINGYDCEFQTHSEVARTVAEGKADVGLGLEASAREYGLDFIFLTEERYDLICLEETLRRPAAAELLKWLMSAEAKMLILSYPGYDGRECGALEWV